MADHTDNGRVLRSDPKKSQKSLDNEEIEAALAATVNYQPRRFKTPPPGGEKRVVPDEHTPHTPHTKAVIREYRTSFGYGREEDQEQQTSDIPSSPPEQLLRGNDRPIFSSPELPPLPRQEYTFNSQVAPVAEMVHRVKSGSAQAAIVQSARGVKFSDDVEIVEDDHRSSSESDSEVERSHSHTAEFELQRLARRRAKEFREEARTRNDARMIESEARVAQGPVLDLENMQDVMQNMVTPQDQPNPLGPGRVFRTPDEPLYIRTLVNADLPEQYQSIEYRQENPTVPNAWKGVGAGAMNDDLSARFAQEDLANMQFAQENVGEMTGTESEAYCKEASRACPAVERVDDAVMAGVLPGDDAVELEGARAVPAGNTSAPAPQGSEAPKVRRPKLSGVADIIAGLQAQPPAAAMGLNVEYPHKPINNKDSPPLRRGDAQNVQHSKPNGLANLVASIRTNPPNAGMGMNKTVTDIDYLRQAEFGFERFIRAGGPSNLAVLKVPQIISNFPLDYAPSAAAEAYESINSRYMGRYALPPYAYATGINENITDVTQRSEGQDRGRTREREDLADIERLYEIRSQRSVGRSPVVIQQNGVEKVLERSGGDGFVRLHDLSPVSAWVAPGGTAGESFVVKGGVKQGSTVDTQQYLNNAELVNEGPIEQSFFDFLKDSGDYSDITDPNGDLQLFPGAGVGLHCPGPDEL